jgi:hypothetical protein
VKTTTSAFREHLDGKVTALCTCWIITRVDGNVYRFTDADEDVVQGGLTYTSIGAYQRTAIETTSSLSVDNLDIVGTASDLALPENELRAGLFDNAEIRIFVTSWLDTVKGDLKMRRGFFGEVQTLPNGTFQVELRGIMQRLSYNYMDIFSATCLYDLGEPGCGIAIKPDEIRPNTSYSVGDFILAQQAGTVRGKVFDLDIGDPDFEQAGAALNGIEDSLFWTNTGANDLVVAPVAYTGDYAARGGAGSGTLTQFIDLTLAGTGATIEALDSNRIYMTLNAWRRDDGDQGRIRVEFLDDDGTELDYGSEADWSSAIPITLLPTLVADFTIECWINPNGTMTGSAGLASFGVTTRAGQGNDINFGGGFPTLYNNIPGQPGEDIIVSPNQLVSGQWKHLAFVREGADVRIYENFELVAEEVGTTYASTFSINRLGGSIGGGLPAQIMEFRIWDVARTQGEIKFNGDRSIDPATANLVRYYSFYDGTFDDATGNDPASNPPGPNGILPATGPVAVATVHTPTNAARFNTGFEIVGGVWTERGFRDRLVPNGTRYARVDFDVNLLTTAPADSYIDNLNGYIIDTSQAGPLLCNTVNNVYWECTSAHTSGSGPFTFTGGPSTVATNFIARDAWLREGRVLSASDARTFVCEVDDVRAVDAWFNGGTVTFQTGPNAGVSMEVKKWDAATNEMELFLSLPNNISAGDLFCVYPGCDKSRISCAAIFDNVFNFFGTPDVPGTDELLRYPNAVQ